MKRLSIFFWFCLVGVLAMTCSHLKEARNAYEEKDFSRTIILTRNAVASDSTDIDAYILLIRSYRRIDSLDRALETALSARKDNPASEDIPEEMVSVHVDIGDKAVSEERLKRALTNFLAAENLAPECLGILRKTADLYFRLGQLNNAKQRYLKILDSPKDTANVREQLAHIEERLRSAQEFFGKGVKQYEAGRFKNAQTLFSHALEQQSDFDDARYNAFMSEGRHLISRFSQRTLWNAISAFGKASTIRPDAAEPHFQMAQAYEKKDDDEFINAIDAYETALKLDPQGPNADTIRKRLDIVKKRKEKLDKFWGRKK